MFYFLLGAIIGSFLNFIVIRFPQRISIISPRSQWTNCKTIIPFYYNIPIISYLLLKGKCFQCSAQISLQYIILETITGIIFLITYTIFPIKVAILYSIVYSSLIVLAIIDLRHLLIPLNLIILLYLMILPKMIIFNQSIIEIILGAFSVTAYLIICVLLVKLVKEKKEVLGLGDILLTIFIGGFLGAINGFICLFLASIIGLIFVAGSKSKTDKIPFGTCISISFMIISILDTIYDVKSFLI